MGFAVAAGVVIWSVALCWSDIRHLRLPNALTLPGAVVILIGAAVAGRGSGAVLGALGLGLLYLVVHLLMPSGLGAGDVKLAVGLGALTGALGAEVWVLAALGAPVFSAAVGLVAAAARRVRIPHGPSMVLASLGAAALAVL